jgi:hypothetical protein
LLVVFDPVSWAKIGGLRRTDTLHAEKRAKDLEVEARSRIDGVHRWDNRTRQIHGEPFHLGVGVVGRDGVPVDRARGVLGNHVDHPPPLTTPTCSVAYGGSKPLANEPSRAKRRRSAAM